ncbi:isochorismate synthase [Stackebrandtia nassauensis]|nr:isochorismate synthase [Stackebrandtia nassauensis]
MHLVDEYRPGSSFFFDTGSRSLLTHGSAIVLPGRGGLAPARADTVLRALGGDQLLVGAVPFSDTEPAQLLVPDVYRWGPGLAGAEAAPTHSHDTPALCEPPPQHYRDAVATALADIDATELSKVVLARSLRIGLDAPVDIPAVLRQLRHRQRRGYVFACPLPEQRDLVGGSPELLVSRNGDVVTAHPLAGSRPRSGDPRVDTARGAELLASEKDRREHAVVVDAIARSLDPYCAELSAPSTPEIVSTGHMLHLGTRVTGRLRDPLPSALSLAAALHPTPAVCGTPTATAREAIARLEGFDRGFYSGMVGWCDSAGNGEWAVTIRCAEIGARDVRLFAGAGIVAGSDPAAELAETEAKLQTMLSALGHTGKVVDERAVHAMA